MKTTALKVFLKEGTIYCPCLHTWCVGGKIWAKPLAMKWSFGIIFALTVLYGALYFSISNVTYLKYCFTKVRKEIMKLRESTIFKNPENWYYWVLFNRKARGWKSESHLIVQIFARFFLWSVADFDFLTSNLRRFCWKGLFK